MQLPYYAINLSLQLAVEQGSPTTTYALESKNSIFKPFSRIAKFFSKPDTCQSFFAATDFFSAVGLPKPQTSLAYITE